MSLESIFSSLLASSLIVGLPSIVLICVFLYVYIGMFKRRISIGSKDSLPPIIGVYIMRCIYSITSYWENLTPQVKMYRITHDFIVFQCLSVVFTLKVIDHLKQKPRTVRELAVLTNSSEKNLFRVMRSLTEEGFFTYNEDDGCFSLNNCSSIFENSNFMDFSYDPNKFDCIFMLFQYPAFINAWGSLKECIETGAPGFQIKHGMSFFQYMDEKDTYLKHIFDSAMRQKANLSKIHLQVSCNYNFNSHPTVCDIGGGVGYLGLQIIKNHPQCNVSVLELEETVKNAKDLFSSDKEKQLILDNEKLVFKVGDMFQPKTIPRASAYVLMQVMHNWNYQDALRILSSITSVMRREKAITKKSPVLLIIDSVIEDSYKEQWKRICISDIIMMAIVGGEERTRDQWEYLFKESGLICQSIKKLNYPPYLSLIELTI
eukprot:gene1477-1863_t